MLGMPDTTEFDVGFRLFGIPVRVHPLFWVVATFLSWRADEYQYTLVGVACVFLSIVVHEFGHGLSSRAFGARPSIVLYMMGGLCFYDVQLGMWRRLAVMFAGPGAGLLLCGASFGTYLALGGRSISPLAAYALQFLVIINLFWSLVSLLPIWPLDGGQITSTILSRLNPHHGARWTHILSLLLAGGLAAWLFSRGQQINALLCVSLAFGNFQILQALHDRSRAEPAPAEDDAEWWKR